MASERTNLWSFIIYPGDSAPENYLEIIQSWHIPAAISPLHEPDEEEKKNHCHVMLYFGMGQKKSYEQVMGYGHQVNSGPAMRVESRSGLLRYFIHYDNPEKQQSDRVDGHQWSERDLILLSGFEIGDSFGSFIKDQEYYKYIEKVIIDHKCVNFMDLYLILSETNCENEIRFIRTHTYYIVQFLDGNYKRLKKKNRSPDPESDD